MQMGGVGGGLFGGKASSSVIEGLGIFLTDLSCSNCEGI